MCKRTRKLCDGDSKDDRNDLSVEDVSWSTEKYGAKNLLYIKLDTADYAGGV